MPNKHDLVALDAPVFRYRSSDTSLTVGIPTNEQESTQAQSLIELDTVYRDREDNLWRYTGVQKWLGINQLISIDEVEVDADANKG